MSLQLNCSNMKESDCPYFKLYISRYRCSLYRGETVDVASNIHFQIIPLTFSWEIHTIVQRLTLKVTTLSKYANDQFCQQYDFLSTGHKYRTQCSLITLRKPIIFLVFTRVRHKTYTGPLFDNINSSQTLSVKK